MKGELADPGARGKQPSKQRCFGISMGVIHHPQMTSHLEGRKGVQTSVTICNVGGWGRVKCCDVMQGL